jgi:hypothetical protein
MSAQEVEQAFAPTPGGVQIGQKLLFERSSVTLMGIVLMGFHLSRVLFSHDALYPLD